MELLFLNADGIGLEGMANFYRTSFEAKDVLLLFLLPQHLVNEVIKSVIHTLHITTTGKVLLLLSHYLI